MKVHYEQIRSVRCDLVYEVRENENNTLKLLKQCIPHKGQVLYEIKADYVDGRMPATYYLLGVSLKEARKRFKSTYTWLQIISIEAFPPGDAFNRVLNDPMLMPLE